MNRQEMIDYLMSSIKDIKNKVQLRWELSTLSKNDLTELYYCFYQVDHYNRETFIGRPFVK